MKGLLTLRRKEEGKEEGERVSRLDWSGKRGEHNTSDL